MVGKRASSVAFAFEVPVVVVVACSVVGIGCGSSRGAASVPQEEKLPDSPVSRFLPLVDGTMWAFDAEDDETGGKGMFVTRIRRLPGPRFSLMTSQGSHVLEARADGIVREESKAYVLHAPLSVGAEWPGENGATVRVSALDRVVQVPAGKFVGCVETIEEVTPKPGKNPPRRVTTTYCPDVGIALLHAEAWEGGAHAGERATLRSFGKPAELKFK
jgi:hypothetical protein